MVGLTAEPEYLPPEAQATSQVELSLTPTAAHPLAERPMEDPLHETAQKAERFFQASKSGTTRRAYASDWRHFHSWCVRNRLVSLPATPETVALYITELADPPLGEKPRKVATITRRLTAINGAHHLAGFDSPARMSHQAVQGVYQGIRRELGTAQTRKRPLTRERIVKVLDTLEGPIAAARDKVLLLIGFAAAMRRSELAAMRVEDLHWHKRGLTINIPKSKTDQTSQGRDVEILWGSNDRTCPLLALEDWLKIARIENGFVIRSVGQYGSVGKRMHPDSIGKRVKELVRRARITNPKEYGGHSLRSGFVTEASANGATNGQIMKQTGHTSEAMVRRYARGDQEDKQTAEGKLGL
jgi:integrase